jgi:leucyl/phenylalanyl-tRNA--protein transferase
MDSSQLAEIIEAVPFPDPSSADAAGLLAYGGDLRPERLLSAYARGIFPWYEEDPILWFSPDPRMVLLPAELRVNRTLAKNLRRGRYEVRLDTAFEAVIRSCAAAPRKQQDGTWITDDMIDAYLQLHELGFAHSAESWREGELCGGVYGVSLGAAFFGESMFASRSDASKIAFAVLVRQLEAWQFHFVDCQVHTDHTAALGAREWSRSDFLSALDQALRSPTRRGRWHLSPDTQGP